MDAVKQGKRRRKAPAPLAAAAAAAAATDGAQRRRPLVPSSEKNNAAAPAAGRRREVPSRFKPVVAPPAATPAPAPAAPAARRCVSPSPARASPAADGSTAGNRARSADRARPAAASSAPSARLKLSTLAAARSGSPARDAAAEARGTPPRARNAKASDGLWASARSSSRLVRPEPAPAPAVRSKKMNRPAHGSPSEQAKLLSGAAAERKRSPLRGSTNNVGDQCENARPSESPANRATDQHRWPGMMSGRGSADLTSTSFAPAEKTSRLVSVSSPTASAGRSPRRMHPSEGTGNSLKRSSNEMAKIVHRRRKKVDSSSDTSSQTSESSKSTCCQNKAISSLVPALHRSSSPRQGLSAAASTSRSCRSPSRMRPSAPCRSKCAPSAAQSGVEQPVFNYIVDAQKGKKNAGQIENIHQLRLMNNRYLQWRFANERSEDTLSQKNGVEIILYSVWKSILTLRDTQTITTANVRHPQQELKLYKILTEQIVYLEQWPVLEEESSCTSVEAIQALKASTLCLPVTSGAQADGVAVRNAISSAVDVMQTLSSSICYLQSKVEYRTLLVSELSMMARQEKVALDQCRELLATAAKLQPFRLDNMPEAVLALHAM